MKVLIVEDDSRVSGFLDRGLKAEGYRTQVAGTAQLGMSLAKNLQTEVTEGAGDALVILDVMLPDMNGFSVTKKIRSLGIMAPVLFLTARDDTEDKIMGLTVGGDDYVTKPFSLDEIVARIHAILRRTKVVELGDRRGHQLEECLRLFDDARG